MLATDRTGQQIGKYYLSRVLASNRFADTYLCNVTNQKQQNVLKCFHLYLFSKEQPLFQQQAQILVNLSHPNIVPILDYGLEASDNAPWLVMPYISSASFRQRYPLGSHLPLSEIVPFVQQLATALQYAHDHQIVHQNIKAENIFLDNTGKLLLSDFALPLVVSHPSIDHEGTFTLAAMPPEQSQGQILPASDQYTLAALAAEWLTGKRWTAVDEMDTSSPGLSLHQKLPALSPLIENVFQTALQPDPTRRFGSINAFATALTQAYQESRSLMTSSLPAPMVSPHLPSPIGTQQRKSIKRAFLVALCTLLILAIGATTLMYFVKNRTQLATSSVSIPTTRTGSRQTQQTTIPPLSSNPGTPAASSTPNATPTPTQPLPATPISTPDGGAVLYQANWGDSWAGSSDWSVSNNTLVNNGSSRDQGAAPTIVVPYSVKSSDYAVEIRARSSSQWPCFDAGTLRGSLDANGWHGYKAAICDQKVRLQAGNDDSILVEVPFQPGNGWHTYHFDAHGPHLRFSVDGTLLVQIDDTRYSAGGQVGLKSYETNLEISDLKIVTPEN